MEGPVSLIEEHLARAVFVADKEIEEPIIINVRPHGGLRASRRLGQACLTGNVGKRSVTVVTQERFAHGEFPRPAQYEQVHASVVVVIGLNQVQPAQLTGQSRLRRVVRKCTVSIVVKESQRLAHVVAGHHNVQQAVILEIVYNHAARHRSEIQSRCGRYIRELPEIFPARKNGRRDQILVRHPCGIFFQRHIREIQQPLYLDRIRRFGCDFQIFRQVLDRLFRIACLLIAEACARRKSTPVERIAVNVVFHLRFMEVSHAKNFRQLRHTCRHIGGREFVRRLPLLDRRIHVALISLKLRQSVVRLNRIVRRRSGHLRGIGQRFFQRLNPFRERLLSNRAHLLQILLPTSRLGKLLEKHIGQDLPRYIRWILNRAFSSQMKIAIRPHPLPSCAQIRGNRRGTVALPLLFLLPAQQLHDDKPCGHFHATAGLPRLE